MARAIGRRRTGALLALLAIVSTLATWQAPPAAPVAQPNIVVILTDDQAVESLAKMPYINGRADWVRFTKAFWNFPLCCPARATMLTGRYSHHTGVEDNDEGADLDETSTIATWLKTAGYHTGYIGKYLNEYPFGRSPYVPPGWNRWSSFNGTAGYYSYSLYENTGAIESHGTAAADYSTDVFTAKAVSFINNASTATPFFLTYAPYAPHDPYTPAPRHKSAYQGTTVPHSPSYNEANVADKPAHLRSRAKVNATTVDEERRKKWRMLLSVDEGVKQIFDALSAKGVLANTYVIFTSDNGFALGEHRWNGKRCEFEECLQSPLLIRGPGATPRTVSRLVSDIDLAPTIAAIGGATPTITVDGASLLPLVQGSNSVLHDALLLRSTAGGIAPISFWGLRTDSWKYIELIETGERELYDLINDPYELHNVAGTPEHAARQATFAEQLALMNEGRSPGPDRTPPARPSRLRMTTHTKTSISLAWDHGGDNVRVWRTRVFRNGKLVGQAPGTTFTDTGLKANTSYTYYVDEVDSAGNLSTASPPLTVKTCGVSC